MENVLRGQCVVGCLMKKDKLIKHISNLIIGYLLTAFTYLAISNIILAIKILFFSEKSLINITLFIVVSYFVGAWANRTVD